MFVHWGIYAVGGLHEQEIWRCGTPMVQYRRYAEKFDPVNFDPVRWLDFFQENGMEYLVFTAKHHDGFCMFDSAATDFKITATPFGRDVFRMLADECHRRNFPLVAYYSVVDWHHPAYPNCGRHHEIVTDPSGHDLAAYKEYLCTQIRELCTNYGTLHGIWWDMNTAGLHDEEINKMIHTLQPQAMINDRGPGRGDFATSERSAVDQDVPGNNVEGCDSVGRFSWGFRRNEDYYSPRFIKTKIALMLARGGNFLLNAGPDADGNFTPEARRVLSAVGTWYRQVRPGLTACPRPEFSRPRQPVTGSPDGDELFWILEEPAPSHQFELPGKNLPPLAEAELLNDHTSLPVDNRALYREPLFPSRRAVLDVPTDANEIPVLRVKFQQKVDSRERAASPENPAYRL